MTAQDEEKDLQKELLELQKDVQELLIWIHAVEKKRSAIINDAVETQRQKKIEIIKQKIANL